MGGGATPWGEVHAQQEPPGEAVGWGGVEPWCVWWCVVGGVAFLVMIQMFVAVSVAVFVTYPNKYTIDTHV